jgi:hypothetical protein
MSKQITSTILMIRPVSFRMNAETAVNNYYQKVIEGLTPEKAQVQALAEFDKFVDVLRAHDVNVIVVDDTQVPETPDSIFPNNWISFHHDGSIALYPMYAENRRAERRSDIKDILADNGFSVERIKDFTSFESVAKYLEGTGSMLLDRDNHIVYAAISGRTDEEVLEAFCVEFGYKAVPFRANQTVNSERLPIYHTNVMMCVTDKLAIVCLDSIDDADERAAVVNSFQATGKQIIDISEDQVNHFAGNMLALTNPEGKKFLVMSAAALQSLNDDQLAIINTHYMIISRHIDTIEALGGGSARCMMAEIFLPISQEN